MQVPIPSFAGRRLGAAALPAVLLLLGAVADVPPPVQQTLTRESAGGKVLSTEKEQEEGGVTYEFVVALGAHRYELEIAADGTLLEKEIVEERRAVSLESLPAPVRTTLRREARGAPLQGLVKRFGAARTVYGATAVLGERTYALRVAEDGTLLVKKLVDRDEHEAAEEDHDEDGEHEAAGEEQDEQEEEGRIAVWSFDRAAPGSPPAGWRIAETSGTGHPATWQVLADASAPSPPHAVAITENANYGHTFNLLLAEDTSYRDLTIKVRVKALAGTEDQGGGPIWRAKDGDNYYIARWNPLEKNFRVYYVKNGRRRQLASSNVDVDPSVWHTIEIRQRGNTIAASLDGRKRMEVTDETFPDPGMVGLWVKADGRTAFDDLEVRSAADRDSEEDDHRPR